MNRETVVITGANRGLGLGLTRAYLEDGWRVIALNRSSSPELESLRNDSLEIHCCDLTDDSHLERFAGSLNGQIIDLLIKCRQDGQGQLSQRRRKRSGIRLFQP
ncbi:MAG: SDR family NAD(P)-dependent oxidoreductase [Gammaproteobacteria bacterium]|nr:SDR family NAD(P)-dependent oxidoreductase [Gammaproteobacteria bacterium]